MFVDYYAILEIGEDATQGEIKAAFKKQALHWHPDRNPGRDTTLRMQQINEAYLILKDPEARQHYNIEYRKFRDFKHRREYERQEKQYAGGYGHERRNDDYRKAEKQHEYTEYTVHDDVLSKWMENARRQAVELAKKTIEDFKGISAVGAKAVANEAVSGAGRFIIFGIVGIIIFALLKTCNRQAETSPRIDNSSPAVRIID